MRVFQLLTSPFRKVRFSLPAGVTSKTITHAELLAYFDRISPVAQLQLGQSAGVIEFTTPEGAEKVLSMAHTWLPTVQALQVERFIERNNEKQRPALTFNGFTKQ